MSKLSITRQSILLALLPLLAVAVAVRQLYLSSYHGLSTWKGGGMGMFAGTDSLDTRYAHVYAILENGERILITRVAPQQERLLRTALYYPLEENFRQFALSLRTTAFVAADRPTPITKLNQLGQRVGSSNSPVFEARAGQPRSSEELPDWTIEIKYWNLAYDSGTRLLSRSLVQTFLFKQSD